MKLQTRHFGEILIREEDAVIFENGLPGFEALRKFILMDGEDPASPFKWLQSVDSPELAFALVDPFAVILEYDVELTDDTVRKLEIESSEEALVYAIVVVPEDVTRMTMNLKAPVVINTTAHKGMQVVLDTDRYSVRHYIVDELRRREGAGHAGADQKKGSIHHHK